MAENKSESGPLPDTTQWKPRESASGNLKSAFLHRCIGLEKEIGLRAKLEKGMNIDNFDSGLGVEDIVREALSQLLPRRYSVKAGVITDRDGNTAGDFEVVVFNEQWFPAVKAGATPQSRRVFLPIDGVYAVCEVKQTLDFESLDAALKKLVTCHRLNRPRTHVKRIVENREGSSCTHGLSNPLYSVIIATDLGHGIELESLINRFFDINKTLKRLEVVRALCVLGHGTVTWSFMDEKGDARPALFMLEDLYVPIFPVYHRMPEAGSSLYTLLTDLLLHLFQSVLAPEDVAPSYGPDRHAVSIPKSPDVVLKPDAEWLSS